MSASFNGTTSYITLPSGFFNYEYTQPWTVSARVYLNVTRSGPAKGYQLLSRLQTSGALAGIEVAILWTDSSTPISSAVISVLLINNYGTNKYIEIGGSTNIANSAWTNVCVTYSGSGVASGVKAYVNGARETEVVRKDGLASSSVLNAITPRIGSRNGAAGAWFAGEMADIGVWDAELTAAEVASLGKGFSARIVRPQSLVLAAPTIRELIDLKGNSMAAANMSVGANTPRIYA